MAELETLRHIPVGSEIDSFYHLSGEQLSHKLCRGMACFAAQHRDPDRWQSALAQDPPVCCLGKCYMAPATTDQEQLPFMGVRCETPVVLAGWADADVRSLVNYQLHGGYQGLFKALGAAPEEAVEQVEISRLRGRGGAGYPSGRKWRAVLNERPGQKYVVANADEGDHGSYIDRFIMEFAPHRLIEALSIAAWAVGADKGFIYLRKEYPKCHTVLKHAIAEARSAGLLGESIHGTDFSFNLEIVIGQGSYVCGEETSLLNSIEHVRPEVRARPPFPTSSGLFGRPTLVQNVETLASIPFIANNGGERYASMGFSNSRGTKAVSLNSLFNNPGVYEVEFGCTLRYIVEDLGGGLKDGDLKALVIGGPLAGFIKPDELDTKFGFEELAAIGANLGHGGVVALSDRSDMLALAAHIFEFGATESCGKCTPCRVGTRRLQKLFDQAGSHHLSPDGMREISELLSALKKTSLCGHGTGLAEAALSLMSKFPEDFKKCRN